MAEKKTILSEYTRDQLWNEFISSPYPKWSSLCLLKHENLPVLDAGFIDVNTPYQRVVHTIKSLTDTQHTESVLIRTDGGRETGVYPQGGNSLSLGDAIRFVIQMQCEGRAVIVMQPTNRFENKLAINLWLDFSGVFRIDLLGPGFDVSDINRGLNGTEVSVTITEVDWTRYDPPHPFFIERRNTPVEFLRLARLRRIGNELLPKIQVQTNGDPEEFAKEWLHEKGYLGLFEEIRPSLTYRQIRKWYDVAFGVGMAYRRKAKWENLVISFSDIGGNKGAVFWDVMNPREKFRFSHTVV